MRQEDDMALSGIQIYKLLPQTNCKDCGFPTCLAFAMKLAAKQVELAACPHVSEEAKAQLSEASAPPVRLVTLKSDGHEVKAGNEVVMFRHEKTFYNKARAVRPRTRRSGGQTRSKPEWLTADRIHVNYVGMDLTLDGFAVEAAGGDATPFRAAISAVREATHRPLILIASDPAVMAAGLRPSTASTR